MSNQNITHVKGLRPHTFVTLLLRNLGPRTPCRNQSLHDCTISIIRTVPGDGQLQGYTEAQGARRTISSQGVCQSSNVHIFRMLRHNASGSEIGLRGRISTGFCSGKPQNRPSGRPSADGPIVRLSRQVSGRNPAQKPISGTEPPLRNIGYCSSVQGLVTSTANITTVVYSIHTRNPVKSP